MDSSSIRRQQRLAAAWNLDVDELLRLADKHPDDRKHFLTSSVETALAAGNLEKALIIIEIGLTGSVSFNVEQLFKTIIGGGHARAALCVASSPAALATLDDGQTHGLVTSMCEHSLDGDGTVFCMILEKIDPDRRIFSLELLGELLFNCPVSKKNLHHLLDDYDFRDGDSMQPAGLAVIGNQAANNISLISVFLERFPEKKEALVSRLKSLYEINSRHYGLSPDTEEFFYTVMGLKRTEGYMKLVQLVKAGRFGEASELIAASGANGDGLLNTVIHEGNYAALCFLVIDWPKLFSASPGALVQCFVRACGAGDMRSAEKLWTLVDRERALYALEDLTMSGGVSKNNLPLVEKIVGKKMRTPDYELIRLLMQS